MCGNANNKATMRKLMFFVFVVDCYIVIIMGCSDVSVIVGIVGDDR